MSLAGCVSLLQGLRASLETFIELLMEPGANLLEDESGLALANYVMWEVLPTLKLFYKHHYMLAARSDGVSDEGGGASAPASGEGERSACFEEEAEEEEGEISLSRQGSEIAQLLMLLGQEAAGQEQAGPPQPQPQPRLRP